MNWPDAFLRACFWYNAKPNQNNYGGGTISSNTEQCSIFATYCFRRTVLRVSGGQNCTCWHHQSKPPSKSSLCAFSIPGSNAGFWPSIIILCARFCAPLCVLSGITEALQSRHGLHKWHCVTVELFLADQCTCRAPSHTVPTVPGSLCPCRKSCCQRRMGLPECHWWPTSGSVLRSTRRKMVAWTMLWAWRRSSQPCHWSRFDGFYIILVLKFAV